MGAHAQHVGMGPFDRCAPSNSQARTETHIATQKEADKSKKCVLAVSGASMKPNNDHNPSLNHGVARDKRPSPGRCLSAADGGSGVAAVLTGFRRHTSCHWQAPLLPKVLRSCPHKAAGHSRRRKR